MTTFTSEDRERAQIYDLHFPKDNFLVRLKREGNHWVWRLDDQGLKMFEEMLSEDKK